MNIKQSRFIAIITALAVIFSIMPTVLADNASDKPTVTIVGSSIKKDDNYFELGIEVTPAEGSSFLSVGVTLAYDRDLLTPVAWDDNGTEPPIGESWTDITAIPALCPAGISGKTVFAYNETKTGATPQPAATSEPSAAPEPSAEPEPTPEQGGEPEGQNDETGDTPEGTPTETPTEAPEPANTDAPGTTPEATYIPPYEHTGYLYISAEAPKKLTKKEVAELNGAVATAKPTEAPTPEPTEEAGSDPTTEPTAEPTASPEVLGRAAQDYTPNRVVTMRFKYAAGKKQAVLDGFANGTVVTLAPDAVAAESPAGQQAMYCTGEEKINLDKDPDRVVEYYYAEAGEDTLGIKYDFPMDRPELKLTELANGSNTGGSDPSKFSAIVFYEWDEKTVLGAVVVDSSAGNDEINESVAAFTQTFMPDTITNADGTTSQTDMATWNDEKAFNCVTYDPSKVLTSHNGYTFGKWIDFNSEAFTIYGNAVKLKVGYQTEDIPAPEAVDYSKITAEQWKSGLILKAAYIANKEMSDYFVSAGSNINFYYYTVYYDEEPTNAYFSRFNATNYSIKFKITRENSEGKPVFRPRKSALKVTYTIGGVQVPTLINLDNVDEQIVEVAVPSANAVTNVSANVIDSAIANWATDSAARSNASNIAINPKSIVQIGNIGYMNTLIQESVEQGAISEQTIADMRGTTIWGASYAGITIAARTVDGGTGLSGNNLRLKAIENLMDGYRAKYADALAAKAAELGKQPDALTDAEKPPATAGYMSRVEMAASIQFGGVHYKDKTGEVTILR